LLHALTLPIVFFPRFYLLSSRHVVLADRYAYTAFARDVTRGVSPAWVRKLYHFAMKPNLAFYFKVPLAGAIEEFCLVDRN